jgi:hypothetical protein
MEASSLYLIVDHNFFKFRVREPQEAIGLRYPAQGYEVGVQDNPKYEYFYSSDLEDPYSDMRPTLEVVWGYS